MSADADNQQEEVQLRGVDESAALEEWAELYPKQQAMLVEVARVEATGVSPFGRLCIEEADGRLTEMKETSGQRALQNLAERGLIEVGSINGKTNKYQLTQFGALALKEGGEELLTRVEDWEESG